MPIEKPCSHFTHCNIHHFNNLRSDQAAKVNHGVVIAGDWNPELDCESLDRCGEQYCVCGEGQ